MAHHIEPLRDPQRDRQLLLDQQNRHAAARDFIEQGTDLFDQFGRQALGGFVDDDQIRIAHQRAAHGQHLLLAAGQDSGGIVPARVQIREQLVDILEVPAPELARALHAQLEILLNRERGEDLPIFRHIADPCVGDLFGPEPGDRAPLETDAAMRLHQSHDRLAGGRAPDAVAPEKTDDLTLGDREVHTLKDVALAVVGMQITYVEHHAASVPR